MAPLILRTQMGTPSTTDVTLGIHSGPRQMMVASNELRGPASLAIFGGGARPDREPFNLDYWGAAWDGGLVRYLGGGVALHVGVQSEMVVGIPLPAFGAYGGLSWAHAFNDTFSIAPSAGVSTGGDFGLATIDASSQWSFQAALAMNIQGSRGSGISVVPFAGYDIFDGSLGDATMYGVAFAIRFPLGPTRSIGEIHAGFSKNRLTNGFTWNAPLVGGRVVR